MLNVAFTNFIKELSDRSFGILVELAHDIDGEQCEKEAGDDFVEAEEGKLFPDEYGHAADDDAGQDAVARGTAPEEGGEQCRSEGGTEACPGVSYHIENEIVRIEAHENGNGCDGKHGNAADPYELMLACFLVDEGMVEILGECRGSDEQL